MYELPDTPCRKCGGPTKIHYIPSKGMDIEPTGMRRTCVRCGFREFIDDLEDTEHNANQSPQE